MSLWIPSNARIVKTKSTSIELWTDPTPRYSLAIISPYIPKSIWLILQLSYSSYSWYIDSRCGLEIEVCHRNQPNKSKLALYIIHYFQFKSKKTVVHSSMDCSYRESFAVVDLYTVICWKTFMVPWLYISLM